MTRLFFTLAIFWAKAAYGDWEVAVATGNGVELLSAVGETVGSGGAPGAALALAFDPLRGHLFFTDPTHPNASIFRMALSAEGIPHQRPQPLVPRESKRVDSVAYDTLGDRLYWSVGQEKRIMVASLGEGNPGPRVLHKFEREIPQGIAVDPCRRNLYWANLYIVSPSIERSRLDGTGREVVVKEGLHMPFALALSAAESALYWLDISNADGRYWIERSDLDGRGRRVVVSSSSQRPYSLAVSPGVAVYWTDWTANSVWRVALAEGEGGPRLPSPTRLKKYPRGTTPGGIVALAQDSATSDHCPDLASLRAKLPSVWSGACRAGERLVEGECSPWSCHNYCLGEGSACSVGPTGLPTCSCPPSLVGARCQMDASICLTLCSLLRPMDKLSHDCRCRSLLESRGGRRLSLGTWEWVSVGLGCCILALLLALAVVGWRLARRRRGGGGVVGGGRPPKRRYRVNPSSSSSSQRGSGGPREQCEIAIENCCNMNICETPCYEPDFPAVATPPSDFKKPEEKKNLLGNIEVNCGDLY